MAARQIPYPQLQLPAVCRAVRTIRKWIASKASHSQSRENRRPGSRWCCRENVLPKRSMHGRP